ncbi:MAG: cache domain-containing protein, partial [Minisyncoccia bacterium]
MNNTERATPIVGGGGSKGKNEEMKRPPIFVTLFLITLPLVLVGVYLVVREFDHQTQVALERRGSVAKLGALLIHEKFDGIINIGTSLASRPLVYQNIEKGNWGESMKAFEGIPQAFPYIEMIGFFDTGGVIKAVIPQTPELIGKSFAHRDYFQGVSKEWKPYVSEAFRRVVEPKYNVVSIAVPIMSPKEKPLGFLLLTIKLDEIVGWSKDIDPGTDSLVFIVDKRGQLVAHNHLKPEDDLVDYSSSETVQRLLAGGSGVEIHEKDFASAEKHVAAYSHVADYGFGIEILQPTRTAFAERNIQTIILAIIWSIIIFVTGLFSYFILRSRAVMKKQRDRERTMLDSVGDGIIAIDRDWKIILWNKSASVITGWGKEEAIGKPFREIIKFIRESDRKENISFIEDAIVMNRTAS